MKNVLIGNIPEGHLSLAFMFLRGEEKEKKISSSFLIKSSCRQ